MNFSSPKVAAVFKEYEARDAIEQRRMAELGPAVMGVRDEFLLPVGRDVGALLHALVLGKRPQRVLELGTSYGYSTLLLADAVAQTGGKLITMELAAYKQAHAREMITKAGLAGVVDFRLGDAIALISTDPGPFDLVLLDIWKELYVPCLEAFYPKLSDEGIIVADNMIEPAIARAEARRFRAALRDKHDVSTTLLPIGHGIELSARWNRENPKL
jgi:predicted O-methyltransferase YrrM